MCYEVVSTESAAKMLIPTFNQSRCRVRLELLPGRDGEEGERGGVERATLFPFERSYLNRGPYDHIQCEDIY